LDLVAHGLQPLSHGALGDTFAQCRQGHLGALRAAAGGTVRGGLRRCGLLLLGLLARPLARRLGLLRLLLLLGGLLLLLRSLLGRALLGRSLLLGLLAATGAVTDHGQVRTDLDGVVLVDENL